MCEYVRFARINNGRFSLWCFLKHINLTKTLLRAVIREREESVFRKLRHERSRDVSIARCIFLGGNTRDANVAFQTAALRDHEGRFPLYIRT